ncbi:hypothetical protein DEM25_000345 [Oceaniradius stylonematis]|jgi:hypothetical protein|uniref:Transporter n=1 Tax=Oceaniradius stylonematis TaxID=2184161 RepID=A0A3A8AHD1_9HYPH|nr:hypothetical protein [Oceaniradius stylonematis]RKF08489.1 hypothetical protein DEM25_000345 [Oceaniradius stylonematis]
MINLDYAFHHVECVAAAITGRPGAIERMDISADGFWRSFTAIAVALPAMFFVWVMNARANQAEMPSMGVAPLVAGEAVFELVVWLLPIPVFALVLRPLGLGHRFVHLVIARNWANALFSYVIAALYVPHLVVADDNGAMMMLGGVLMVLILVAAVRLTRAALDSSVSLAMAFIAGEFIVSIALAIAYLGMLGL